MSASRKRRRRDVCGLVLGAVGPGRWSLDDALEPLDDLTGRSGLLISAGAGVVGAVFLLAISWRPPSTSD